MNVIALNPVAAKRGHAKRVLAPTCTEAVILAAGRGSRLASFTSDRPKCLVEVGGAPLIEHQLRMLKMAGIDRVTVVVGYRADEVRRVLRGRARMIDNGDWNDTNSLYSVSLCRGHVNTSMLVMNCDVLVHPLALQRLLTMQGSSFLYDSSSGASDEEMKVELTDGRVTAMSKTLPADRTHGENVGILYFEAAATRMLFRVARELVADGHRNMWMAAAVERVAHSVPLYGVDVADLPWIEIDFPDDLERACAQVWRQVTAAFAPAMRLAG